MKNNLFETDAEAMQFYTTVIQGNEINEDYLKSVKDFLERLEPGKVITIADIVKEKNIEFFMQCVSLHIVTYEKVIDITFSDDYKQFKKNN